MENLIRQLEIEHSVIVVHGRKMFVFLLELLVFLSVYSRLLSESGPEIIEEYFLWPNSGISCHAGRRADVYRRFLWMKLFKCEIKHLIDSVIPYDRLGIRFIPLCSTSDRLTSTQKWNRLSCKKIVYLKIQRIDMEVLDHLLLINYCQKFTLLAQFPCASNKNS